MTEHSSRLVINEVSGDLFDAPTKYALGHCVAADLKMGKGIAVKFRDKFNASSILKQQKVKPGGVAVNKFGDRFIYNLVTKSLSYHKPTYQILSESLYAMRDHMLQHNVKYLAMPRIGSGLDGLVWEKVRDLIVETFENDDVEIMVYKYVPLKAN